MLKDKKVALNDHIGLILGMIESLYGDNLPEVSNVDLRCYINFGPDKSENKWFEICTRTYEDEVVMDIDAKSGEETKSTYLTANYEFEGWEEHEDFFENGTFEDIKKLLNE